MASNEYDGAIGNLPHFAGKTPYDFDLAESEADLSSPRPYPHTRARPFGALVERALSSIWHGKKVMLLQIASYILIALWLGMCGYDIGNDAAKVLKNVGCIFLTILFAVLIGTMPTILTFPRKMANFVRENHNSKHSMLAFYIAKLMIDLPFHFLFSSIYAIVIYIMTSQPTETFRLYIFSRNCVLTSLASYSLGLLIAVGLSGKPNTTQGTVPIAISVPVFLFAGFGMDFYLRPDYFKLLTWFSYVRYAFDGAVIGVYGFGREKLECSNDYCHFRHPNTLLKELSIEEESYFGDAYALVYVSVLLQIFAVCLILQKPRSYR